MKLRLVVFGKYLLFWLGLFVFSTLLFLVYHYPLSQSMSPKEWGLSLLYGMRMDMSMTGYLTLIPGLMITFTSFLKGKFLRVFFNIYTITLIIVTIFIIVADLELYRNWGFRMDATPLLYLNRPKEAVGSSDPLTTLMLITMWLVLVALAIYIYKNWIGKDIKRLPRGNWKIALTFLFLTGSLILPIRGSLDKSNMNAGFAYYHNTNVFANHAGINVIWNVGYALKKLRKANYPTNFFDNQETQKLFSYLHEDKGETPVFLNTKRPNVVIVALESFTSKIIEPLGGRKGVTPNFNKLTKEGILFSHIYSSGDRTDRGVASILGGYPAQPKTSVIKYPKKTQYMPYLNKDFKQLGYHTSFIYGYDIDYSNFRSYLGNGQFDLVISKENFGSYEYESKWGIHDHEVLDRIIRELNKLPQPFFHMTMTLSSHEPFDVPMETVFEGNDEENLFFNSAYYTDKALGSFVEQAKRGDWWDNTLMILVADHGCRHPGADHGYSETKFTIPMLWIGGALNKKDTVINTFGNQTDIARTVLKQIDLDNENYLFSRNLLSDRAKSFSFYVFNNGYGFMSDSIKAIYDLNGNRYIRKEGLGSESQEALGKAYLQKLYLDFNSR
ncbi:sulfatase-like hydrolase/transferase [Fulvivirgaceae bacterium BMA10]|uniref:Sulfatase-like hydrolase/transferase n=1 Tax=Splendidivirga corallicola TaxID=3051826 RepID=A0ABT8KZF0_9BACT|nr:sulfatase-like hydrolase/transferase [Fulvivirgaceae bacterium BMA10]